MKDCKQHKEHDGSWWEYDSDGIFGVPIVRVCEKCKEKKLAKHRKEMKDDKHNRPV